MKKWLCLALALLTLTVCVWAAAESTDWNYDRNYAIRRGYNGAGVTGARRDRRLHGGRDRRQRVQLGGDHLADAAGNRA